MYDLPDLPGPLQHRSLWCPLRTRLRLGIQPALQLGGVVSREGHLRAVQEAVAILLEDEAILPKGCGANAGGRRDVNIVASGAGNLLATSGSGRGCPARESERQGVKYFSSAIVKPETPPPVRPPVF